MRRVLVAMAVAMGGCAKAAPAEVPTACADGPTLEGIDVSSYQASVDWTAVRAEGKRFAFVRVAHGVELDRTFPRNWSALLSEGMVRGAYLYVDPEESPDEQAELVVRSVGRLLPGDLPVTLDVEARAPGVTAQRWGEVLRVLSARITAGTGRAPMIYTRRNYWTRRVGTAAYATRPLWAAHYTLARCPAAVPPWPSWSFWQYSSDGVVRGVAGRVDLDRFQGTEETLRAMTGVDLDAGAVPLAQ